MRHTLAARVWMWPVDRLTGEGETRGWSDRLQCKRASARRLAIQAVAGIRHGQGCHLERVVADATDAAAVKSQFILQYW